MHLGEYLKIVLIKKGLSQQDLANLLNNQKNMNAMETGNATVTRFQVSAWVTGTQRISPLMAKRIELALDLPDGFFREFTTEIGSNMAGYNAVFGKEEGDAE